MLCVFERGACLMQDILDYYKEELDNIGTNFFILDTKGTTTDHGDVDFVSYDWSPSKYGRVNAGDLFIYRRPQNASEIKNSFYFFGAGRIKEIKNIGKDKVRGIIDKAILFESYLTKTDLDEFEWEFKQRGETWAYLFHQYGMTQIKERDFRNIIKKAYAGKEHKEIVLENIVNRVGFIQEIQNKNYFVDDNIGTSKRRSGQSTFSNEVKKNYRYECAITGIKIKEFLVGSHIIPWAENKNTRLDPQNGICLSVLLDRAFDQGYITIHPDLTIEVSKFIESDIILKETLMKFSGKKIKKPSFSPPKEEYLRWHYENIFKK
ncbi:HNH endonuclease [Bacillus thuringiensis]|uniref:HNH endonuclease n=2 Tax=Bacillus TaxID=1386 RepID=A0A9X7AL06_BACTU|nr:HNH endonuclease [Bacillus thuringiensis]